MPGKDGSGPLGNGPITGRGFGSCELRKDMYLQNRNRTFSTENGAYCGKGRGFRNRYYADGFFPADSNVPQIDVKHYLKNKLKNLEQEISSVKNRLTKINSK